jgi:hypothetical protein
MSYFGCLSFKIVRGGIKIFVLANDFSVGILGDALEYSKYK